MLNELFSTRPSCYFFFHIITKTIQPLSATVYNKYLVLANSAVIVTNLLYFDFIFMIVWVILSRTSVWKHFTN